MIKVATSSFARDKVENQRFEIVPLYRSIPFCYIDSRIYRGTNTRLGHSY